MLFLFILLCIGQVARQCQAGDRPPNRLIEIIQSIGPQSTTPSMLRQFEEQLTPGQLKKLKSDIAFVRSLIDKSDLFYAIQSTCKKMIDRKEPPNNSLIDQWLKTVREMVAHARRSDYQPLTLLADAREFEHRLLDLVWQRLDSKKEAYTSSEFIPNTHAASELVLARAVTHTGSSYAHEVEKVKTINTRILRAKLTPYEKCKSEELIYCADVYLKGTRKPPPPATSTAAKLVAQLLTKG